MANPRWQYHLRVLQQPSRARLCSFKEANDTIIIVDRRPVDPPPVVEVYTLGDNSSLLESTSLFIHASLVLPELDGFSYPLAKTPSGISATTGENIQTPEKLRMMDERLGALCVFAKLSIRMPGLFRLKFTLFQTTQLGLSQVGDTVSEPFEVFSPKLFTGMRESTMFTRHLAMQGIKVKLRSDTSAGRAERRPPRKRRVTPPSSSSPSLVWRPGFQPRPSRLHGDDGLVHLAHLAVESELNPSGPSGSSADLSSFSLGPIPDRQSSSASALSNTKRSDISLVPSTASLRLGSPRPEWNTPRSSSLIGTGDDGIPYLPSLHPVLPHISNLLGPTTSPPPRLPPLRFREDQL